MNKVFALVLAGCALLLAMYPAEETPVVAETQTYEATETVETPATTTRTETRYREVCRDGVCYREPYTVEVAEGVERSVLKTPVTLASYATTTTTTSYSNPVSTTTSRPTFMSRGPVRRFVSAWRGRRLQRISRWPGPRGQRACNVLGRMSARGNY